MKRFRLKFPKQEIELLPGTTLIGRSPACAVTIEDPLVSREHARVHVTEDEAIYEDLASRNGSRINGVLVYMPAALRHGDVITIGKHEIRFSVVSQASVPKERPTGFMRSCSRCSLPYAADAGACPHCASPEYFEEPPNTQQFAEPAWALDMLVEMLDRAVAMGRSEDVQRIVRRAVSHVDEQLAAGMHVDRKQLGSLVHKAEGALPAETRAKLLAWAKSVGERRL